MILRPFLLTHLYVPPPAIHARKVVGVYLAESLNTMGSQYWESFAGQNYFDKQGAFTSTLWSGPLIIIAVVILVHSWPNTC